MKPLTNVEEGECSQLARLYHIIDPLFRDKVEKSTDKAYCAIPISGHLFYILKRIKKTFPKYKNFYDIGCGMGSALIIARYFGYNTYGVELRKEYKKQLQRIGENIIIDDAFKYLKYHKILEKSIVYYYRPIPNSKLMDKLTDLIVEVVPKDTLLVFWGHGTSSKLVKCFDNSQTYLKL